MSSLRTIGSWHSSCLHRHSQGTCACIAFTTARIVHRPAMVCIGVPCKRHPSAQLAITRVFGIRIEDTPCDPLPTCMQLCADACPYVRSYQAGGIGTTVLTLLLVHDPFVRAYVFVCAVTRLQAVATQCWPAPWPLRSGLQTYSLLRWSMQH